MNIVEGGSLYKGGNKLLKKLRTTLLAKEKTSVFFNRIGTVTDALYGIHRLDEIPSKPQK